MTGVQTCALPISQTVGELRNRAEPLFKLEGLHEVERILERFADLELVVKLERGAGERDARWTHIMTGAPALPPMSEARGAGGGANDLVSRVEVLEAEVLALRSQLERLKNEPS